MGYPEPNKAVIIDWENQPEPLDPLDLPPEEADMVFGKPVMDLLRAIRKQESYTIHQYVKVT